MDQSDKIAQCGLKTFNSRLAIVMGPLLFELPLMQTPSTTSAMYSQVLLPTLLLFPKVQPLCIPCLLTKWSPSNKDPSTQILHNQNMKMMFSPQFSLPIHSYRVMSVQTKGSTKPLDQTIQVYIMNKQLVMHSTMHNTSCLPNETMNYPSIRKGLARIYQVFEMSYKYQRPSNISKNLIEKNHGYFLLSEKIHMLYNNIPNKASSQKQQCLASSRVKKMQLWISIIQNI